LAVLIFCQYLERVWYIMVMFLRRNRLTYQAILNKHNNILQVGNISEQAITWDFPKLGKPYTEELARRKPNSIEAFYDGRPLVLRPYTICGI
jgi:hypothetical protein